MSVPLAACSTAREHLNQADALAALIRVVEHAAEVALALARVAPVPAPHHVREAAAIIAQVRAQVVAQQDVLVVAAGVVEVVVHQRVRDHVLALPQGIAIAVVSNVISIAATVAPIRALDSATQPVTIHAT